MPKVGHANDGTRCPVFAAHDGSVHGHLAVRVEHGTNACVESGLVLEGFDRQPDGRQRVEFSGFKPRPKRFEDGLHARDTLRIHRCHAAPRPVTPCAAVQRK